MSVAGGLHHAFDHGVVAGCDCLQIFVKNQRQWSANALSDEQVRLFKEAQRACGLGPVVAHASYLLNMAAPASEARARTVAALVDELERCEALGIRSLVVHPGAHLGDGVEAGVGRIVESLDEVHARTRGFEAKVALETTAGQGSTLGHEVEQLAQILHGVRELQRLAICMDTCHVFAAGYDVRRAEEYEGLIRSLDRQIGLKALACIHANDSRFGCGSRKDRHAHIGEGHIGTRGFAHFVNDARLQHVPMILETAKGVDKRGKDLDQANLARLRRLVSASADRRGAGRGKSPGRAAAGRAAPRRRCNTARRAR